jgi:NAD(P)-dependent dehydrogenase (short-subunit alcohol dehydrogenase family)
MSTSTSTNTTTALIFGATGSIGQYIFEELKKENIQVIGTTTNSNKIFQSSQSDNMILVTSDNQESLKNISNVDIVIWAQGCNFNDNINNFNQENFNNLMDGNVTFVLNTLKILLNENKIQDNAKLVIISSIWEEFTRENKLSYSISKAALSGLVKNLSFDLSSKNILINNVLPGVIDNEMTRKTLDENQLNYIKNYLNFGRLVNLDDVYRLVKFLVIENTGITGQSIRVDLGFTNVRKYK